MQNAECEMMVSLRDESNTRRNASNFFITWRECSFIASFYLMLIGLNQQRGRLLYIGSINGTMFDENVGKGLAPSGGVQHDN